MLIEDRLFYAWVAGILDGESCFRIHYRKRKTKEEWTPDISIQMTHFKTIEKISKHFNTPIYIYDRPVEKRKRIYSIYFRNMKRVEYLLDKVSPFLVTKKKQAALMTGYIKVFRSHTTKKYTTEERILKNKFFLKFKELNS